MLTKILKRRIFVQNAENNQLTKSQSLGTLTTIGKTKASLIHSSDMRLTDKYSFKFASETRKADFFSRKLSVRSVNATQKK